MEPKRSTFWDEFHVPLLMLAAFALGAVGTWAIMRSLSSGGPQIHRAEQLAAPPQSAPPDVSSLSRADAAKTLADWNYDRQNWSHAIDHYQEAIAAGYRLPLTVDIQYELLTHGVPFDRL